MKCYQSSFIKANILKFSLPKIRKPFKYTHMTEGPIKISPAIPERPFPIPTMPPQKQSVHKSDTIFSLKTENAGEPPLSDTGLENLRKKITETMLALLVKVFEWKLSLDKS